MAEAPGIMRGKRGLVLGVANNRSIAWGIARVLAAHGARPDAPDAKGRTPAQMADGGITAVREAFRAAFPPPA